MHQSSDPNFFSPSIWAFRCVSSLIVSQFTLEVLTHSFSFFLFFFYFFYWEDRLISALSLSKLWSQITGHNLESTLINIWPLSLLHILSFCSKKKRSERTVKLGSGFSLFQKAVKASLPIICFQLFVFCFTTKLASSVWSKIFIFIFTEILFSFYIKPWLKKNNLP